MQLKKITQINTVSKNQDTDLSPRIDCNECAQIEGLCRKHLLVKYNYVKYLIDDIKSSLEDDPENFKFIARKIKKQRKQLPSIWAKIDRLIEWRNRH